MGKSTTEDFIEKAKIKHNKIYDYSLVNYINAHTKVDIICSIHGKFTQAPTNHLGGQGCPECSGNIKLTTKKFIEKSILKHGLKYDYSLSRYINGENKIKIICPIHGEFNQRSENHLRGDGCPKCSCNQKLTTEEFIEKSKLTHGDKYDYSFVNYLNNSKKVIIICDKHGKYLQNPNNHINGNGCPKCRESKGEKTIREYLINKNINYISQHRFNDCRSILPLPFDFYLPDNNICIEFNGRQHYESIDRWGGHNELIEVQYRDKIKMEYCQNNNIPLIVIKYNENILNKLKQISTPKIPWV